MSLLIEDSFITTAQHGRRSEDRPGGVEVAPPQARAPQAYLLYVEEHRAEEVRDRPRIRRRSRRGVFTQAARSVQRFAAIR